LTGALLIKKNCGADREGEHHARRVRRKPFPNSVTTEAALEKFRRRSLEEITLGEVERAVRRAASHSLRKNER